MARERLPGGPAHHRDAALLERLAHTSDAPAGGGVELARQVVDELRADLLARLELPNLLRKSDYHQLASFVRPQDVDAEVVEVLDAIDQTAALAVRRS